MEVLKQNMTERKRKKLRIMCEELSMVIFLLRNSDGLSHSNFFRVCTCWMYFRFVCVHKQVQLEQAAARKCARFRVEENSSSAKEVDHACIALKLRVFCGLFIAALMLRSRSGNSLAAWKSPVAGNAMSGNEGA
jgi:hypothetical protein